jgi:hypothetical protein
MNAHRGGAGAALAAVVAPTPSQKTVADRLIVVRFVRSGRNPWAATASGLVEVGSDHFARVLARNDGDDLDGRTEASPLEHPLLEEA